MRIHGQTHITLLPRHQAIFSCVAHSTVQGSCLLAYNFGSKSSGVRLTGPNNNSHSEGMLCIGYEPPIIEPLTDILFFSEDHALLFVPNLFNLFIFLLGYHDHFPFPAYEGTLQSFIRSKSDINFFLFSNVSFVYG